MTDDRDFYCSTAGGTDCPEKGNCQGCPDYHRKWPTPEQFQAEYGRAYPDDWAVYVSPLDCMGWTIKEYGYVKNSIRVSIVCACTPFGKPPNGWRPE